MQHRAFPLMLFAAGLGTRMRHLTADKPKPLIPVAGRPLIDRALDLAGEADANPIVVNTHYLGAMLETYLANRGLLISPEPGEILETGGGLKQALPLLGADPVMTLNPDAVWCGPNPLSLLKAAWDPRRMDALLLVQDIARVKGRSGKADFEMDGEGRLTRTSVGRGVLYLGAQILRTEAVAECPEHVFSLNRVWDGMISTGRLYGLCYDGRWCDVGSPEGLAEAEAMLEAG